MERRRQQPASGRPRPRRAAPPRSPLGWFAAGTIGHFLAAL